ncbi:protein of unknown function [Candidatus Methylomirabilis oxygeniifera]|uniref:Uncharacterized protein n=1 Tax=Methylomirabilis oxygeniifera TaxID=671143 RepID=D5MM75_METO1|nr:protein of unknown function [Candidatus Methylomirabilis oxyfera]
MNRDDLSEQEQACQGKSSPRSAPSGRTIGLRQCFVCGGAITLQETYLLAEGPTADIVRTVCRPCYCRKSLEIREAVRRERDEGFIR